MFVISLSNAVHTSNVQENSLLCHACKTYPVFKVSTECLLISWSWALDNESSKNYFIHNFVLRVLSAEFQTSRSEVRRKRMWRKLPLLDSYLYNLPSSAKIFIILQRVLFILSLFFEKFCVNLLPAPLLLLVDICCQSVGSNDTFCKSCRTLIAAFSRVAFFKFNILSVSSVLYWPYKDWR